MNIFHCILWCFVCWNFSVVYNAPQSSPPGRIINNSYNQWFAQKLDHFSPSSPIWHQQYRTNAEYYDYNGLVFLMIGGEIYGASETWNDEWIEYYALQFNALCFQLEHRYYGDSHPTIDLSTENLAYLTTEQALADIEYFITQMKIQYRFPDSTKWVLFGASYAGTLAALARMKYPHLVHYVVASSSPLISKIDFDDYFKKIQSEIEEYGQECSNNIKQANRMLDNFLKTEEGIREIESKLTLCNRIEMNNEKDKAILFSQLAAIFGDLIQHNIETLTPVSMNSVCYIMVNNEIPNVFDRYAEVIKQYNIANNKQCVTSSYSFVIDFWKSTSWNSDSARGHRQWLYQTCTEWGYFLTSNEVNNIFSNYFPVDFYITACTDVFGPSFNLRTLTLGVQKTNTLLSNLQIDGDRTIYSEGTKDPWSILGTAYINLHNNVAVIIEGEAHCSDIYLPHDSDSAALQDARVQIKERLHTWLY